MAFRSYTGSVHGICVLYSPDLHFNNIAAGFIFTERKKIMHLTFSQWPKSGALITQVHLTLLADHVLQSWYCNPKRHIVPDTWNHLEHSFPYHEENHIVACAQAIYFDLSQIQRRHWHKCQQSGDGSCSRDLTLAPFYAPHISSQVRERFLMSSAVIVIMKALCESEMPTYKPITWWCSFRDLTTFSVYPSWALSICHSIKHMKWKRTRENLEETLSETVVPLWYFGLPCCAANQGAWN